MIVVKKKSITKVLFPWWCWKFLLFGFLTVFPPGWLMRFCLTSTCVFLSKEVFGKGLEIQGMPAKALWLLRYGFPLWSQVKHLNKHSELLWSQALGQIPFFPPCKATAVWVLSPFSLFLRAHTHTHAEFWFLISFYVLLLIYIYRYTHIHISYIYI